MFPWRYRIHAICILSVLAIIFYPMFSIKPDRNKVEAANAAAIEFLSMVDAGNYADSWQISAPYLKATVPLQDWQDKLAQIRSNSGPIVSRSLEDANFTAPAKELPESEFIMLEYDSEFEKQAKNEVITVLLGDDDSWRVVGYFLQ